jgi:hypothetical protein
MGDTSVADIVFRLVDWLSIAVGDGHLKTMLAKFIRAPNGRFSCFEFGCVCGSSPREDSTDNEHHPSPHSSKEKPRGGGAVAYGTYVHSGRAGKPMLHCSSQDIVVSRVQPLEVTIL